MIYEGTHCKKNVHVLQSFSFRTEVCVLQRFQSAIHHTLKHHTETLKFVIAAKTVECACINKNNYKTIFQITVIQSVLEMIH